MLLTRPASDLHAPTSASHLSGITGVSHLSRFKYTDILEELQEEGFYYAVLKQVPLSGILIWWFRVGTQNLYI
jgi:hypothetical protein